MKYSHDIDSDNYIITTQHLKLPGLPTPILRTVHMYIYTFSKISNFVDMNSYFLKRLSYLTQKRIAMDQAGHHYGARSSWTRQALSKHCCISSWPVVWSRRYQKFRCHHRRFLFLLRQFLSILYELHLTCS